MGTISRGKHGTVERILLPPFSAINARELIIRNLIASQPDLIKSPRFEGGVTTIQSHPYRENCVAVGRWVTSICIFESTCWPTSMQLWWTCPHIWHSKAYDTGSYSACRRRSLAGQMASVSPKAERPSGRMHARWFQNCSSGAKGWWLPVEFIHIDRTSYSPVRRAWLIGLRCRLVPSKPSRQRKWARGRLNFGW